MTNKLTLSCVITVYIKTSKSQFLRSLESILNQTFKSDEIIIICDGVISNELNDCISNLVLTNNFIKCFNLDCNYGPGFARHFGILKTTTDLIAIMDSDDVSRVNRFELLLNEFYHNEHLSLCGGAISETDSTNIRVRSVPLHHHDIIKKSKILSPFNNVTVMFKRFDYLLTGGYPNKRTSEDYELWLRFFNLGFHVKNISNILVDVHLGDSGLNRRNGFKVFKDDLSTQFYSYKINNINVFSLFINIIIYSSYRFLPVFLIKRLLYKFMRSNA